MPSDSKIGSLKAKLLFLALAGLMLSPRVSGGFALVLGVGTSFLFGNPYLDRTRAWTSRLLSLSVMGLGAGMDLEVVGRVGLQGVGYTIVGIASTFLIGTLLGRLLKVESDTSLLVTVGTAICGGSAIAALAPTIRAKDHEVSVALGTVFLLNAVGLLLFPVIGHFLGLTETQFGLWGALAIHDTSSVVGATLAYGSQAVQIGTTVKLARALWIVPVTFAIGFYRTQKTPRSNGRNTPTKRPWFILGFLIMAALVTWIPSLQEAGHWIDAIAKRALVLTLFLIGSNLSPATLKSVGAKPFVQGTLLWLIMASGTLSAVLMGWIR